MKRKKKEKKKGLFGDSNPQKNKRRVQGSQGSGKGIQLSDEECVKTVRVAAPLHHSVLATSLKIILLIMLICLPPAKYTFPTVVTP